MGNEPAGLDKTRLEKEWASYEAQLKLNEEDRAKWNSWKYTVRPYVYFNKILLVWTIEKGLPKVKDVLTITSLDVSFQHGIWVRMLSKVTGKEHMITHTPRKVPGVNVFAWVPYFNEVRFASAEWEDPTASRNLRLALCFKMQTRPEGHLTEGQDYLTELHVFRQSFPAYRNTRF